MSQLILQLCVRGRYKKLAENYVTQKYGNQ